MSGAASVALAASACAYEPVREGPVAREAERSTWAAGQKLQATEVSQVGSFGTSVAVSGDTALVGSLEGNFAGAAYVVERSKSGWKVQQRLAPSDAATDAYFGTAVALSGNRAVIGASEDSLEGGTYQGAAYIFERTTDGFSQKQKLRPLEPVDGSFFGRAVAIESDTALIGSSAGAYVFMRDESGWTERQTLTAGSAAASMGQAVALDGLTAIVGADAAVYVFVQSGTSFALQQELLPPDGEDNHYFGMSVAVSGDWAAVGSYLDATNDLGRPGSAYLFERHGTSWEFAQKLQAPDGSGDWFGFDVALCNERLLVGADYEGKSGAAYVFLRGGRDWTLEQRLTGIDDGGDDKFGAAVALDDRTAIVGAWSTRVDDFGQAGLAYAYALPEPDGAGGASGNGPGAGGAAGADEAPSAPAMDAGVRPPPVDAGGTEALRDGGAATGDGHDEPATAGSVPDAGRDASAPDREDASDASAKNTEPTETVTEGDWGLGCSVGAAPSPRRPWVTAWCLALLAAFARRRASTAVRRHRSV